MKKTIIWMTLLLVSSMQLKAQVDPYIGEIRITSFNYAPKGWALCNGQLLPINQNQALFSILGTTYGGDGRITFALPDLRGRVPIHMGNGFVLGERGGSDSHTLITSEMPAHTHALGTNSVAVEASTDKGTLSSPVSNYYAVNPARGNEYATTSNATGAPLILAPATVGNSGGTQPHSNVKPNLTVNYIIALVGIYPSQN